MKKVFAFAPAALFLIVSFTACKKQSEQLSTPVISDYFPLNTGDVSVYRLDSTLLFNFNTQFRVHSYHIKDSVESTFTDNRGRLSYRIFRFITDTTEARPWTFDNTFTATPADDHLEYVVDNLRFIKLHKVLTNGYRWKAHSFINTQEESTKYLDEWEYEYNNIGNSYTDTLFNKTYENTVTVSQIDEFEPFGPFDKSLDFQERKYGIEVYAKGTGLVYKDFLHWVWQGQINSFEDNGFGIRMSFIRHN